MHDEGFAGCVFLSPVKAGEGESDHGPQSKGASGRVPSRLCDRFTAGSLHLQRGHPVATIRIRNVPEAVRDTLAKRAKSRGLSLEDYIRSYLLDTLVKSDREEVFRRIDERRASLPRIDVRSPIERSDGGRF